MSVSAHPVHHVYYMALEDLLHEIAPGASSRRVRKPRLRVQPLQVRIEPLRVWGVLVTVSCGGDVHSAWTVAD